MFLNTKLYIPSKCDVTPKIKSFNIMKFKIINQIEAYVNQPFITITPAHIHTYIHISIEYECHKSNEIIVCCRIIELHSRMNGRNTII